jgi:hypothetical protein
VCVFERWRNGEESFWKEEGWVVEVVAKKTRILCDCRYDVNNECEADNTKRSDGNNRKTFQLYLPAKRDPGVHFPHLINSLTRWMLGDPETGDLQSSGF